MEWECKGALASVLPHNLELVLVVHTGKGSEVLHRDRRIHGVQDAQVPHGCHILGPGMSHNDMDF